MADTSQQELTEPHTNGAVDGLTEEEKSKMRPADIDADMREMDRRKRVLEMMGSKTFMAELERILEAHRDGGGSVGLLQQISDMMGAQGARFNSNVFRNSNCVVPINDIRGGEVSGYQPGEKQLRCKLAAVFRLLDLYGWTQGVSGQISARLSQDQEHFLVNPYGLLYHEITASSLVKVDMQSEVVDQGTTNFGIHLTEFQLHSTIHAARPDITCIIHITTPTVTAVSSLKCGLLPIGNESIVIGDVSTHHFIGDAVEPEEREKITRNLGPMNKVMLLTNRGALCCGETVEEAFFNVYNTVLACETQLKLMPMGIENLTLISEETKKAIFDASRKSPAPPNVIVTEPPALAKKLEKRWRIGGTEFEALMRMLDNAGFRTGYSYRNKLIKSEPPRAKNDVEIPPTVSSLGYSLADAELYREAILKSGRKGNDRKLWLTTPNVYQKVEVLETGTPDPKKITKWVSDGSPTHSSTPVKIDGALQFVPKNTNPKEFKQLQQQIKDYRRADKISAGPQSHILEGVSWDEAKKLQDATASNASEPVVLVGAASKGIIQRGFQHNAMVYKTPYAKNPFDAITDQEIDQYKKDVERKQKGDIYDESQSESEALSSFNISRATHDTSTAKSPIQSPISVTSETEEESRDEPRVLRIEKKKVPAPSQPEVVLSDDRTIINFETTTDINEKTMMNDWWLTPINEERKLEVTRSVTIKKYPAPKIIEINHNPNVKKTNTLCSLFKKPKLSHVIARRKFFSDFYSRSVLPVNIISGQSKKDNIEKGFVKNVIQQFSSKENEINIGDKNMDVEKQEKMEKKEFTERKRPAETLPSPMVTKIPKLLQPVLVDLKSPGLVGAIMNAPKQKTDDNYSSSEDDFADFKLLPQTPNDTFTIEKPEESKISSSSEHTMTHSSEMITVHENFIFPEVNSAEKKNLEDNSEEKESREKKLESLEEENLSEQNEIEQDKNLNETWTVTDEDQNEKTPDKNGNSLSTTREKMENSNWLNDSLDTMEETFKKELPENQPWRFSSPINQNYLREDSMTEVINSLNENLTPSKIKLPNRLRETNNSSKYFLDSNQMSLLYSLTTTAEFDDEISSKEHFNCGRPDCSGCLVVNSSPEAFHEDNSEYLWDEIIEGDSNKKQLDLNETIDLFNNSLESNAHETPATKENNDEAETTTEPVSPTDSIDRFSTGGCSDVLELPHATFIEIQQSNDQLFHTGIVNSANEIIAGIGERETIVKAESIVQGILDDVECLNLEIIKKIPDNQTNIPVKSTVNKIPRKNKNDSGFVVIEELIHHIIDKSGSTIDHLDSTGSSTDSLNPKKLKENTNAELKEMQSIEKPEDSEDESHEVREEQDSGIPTTPDDLVNDAKITIDENQDENLMKKKLEIIVASAEPDEKFSTDAEAFEHYASQMELIAKTSDISIMDLSSIEGKTNESSDTGLENCSESVKEFMNRFKELTKSSDSSSKSGEISSSSMEINLSATRTEDSLEQVSSVASDSKLDSTREKFENNVIKTFCIIEYEERKEVGEDDLKNKVAEDDLRNEMAENDLQNEVAEDDLRNEMAEDDLQNEDAKDDLQNEDTADDLKNEDAKGDLKTEIVEDDLKNHEDVVDSFDDQDSLENSIGSIKEEKMIYLWNLKESERERQCNEIRANEDITSFIQYEQVDDIPLERSMSMEQLDNLDYDDQSFKKKSETRLVNVCYKLEERKDSLEPIIETNEDVEEEAARRIKEEHLEPIIETNGDVEEESSKCIKEEQLEPIVEDEEEEELMLESQDIKVKEVSTGEVDKSEEEEELMLESQDIKVEEISTGEVDKSEDLSREFLSCYEESSTIYETGSSDVAGTISTESWCSVYQNTNTETPTLQSIKSESGDEELLSSSYEQLSGNLPSNSEEIEENDLKNSPKKCSNCKKLLADCDNTGCEEEFLINSGEKPDFQADICSFCMMTLSVDTQEFIRMEMIVKSEEIEDDKISTSGSSITLDIPKYEDTLLYRLVNKTDNLNADQSSATIDESFDFSDTICSIRMLFN